VLWLNPAECVFDRFLPKDGEDLSDAARLLVVEVFDLIGTPWGPKTVAMDTVSKEVRSALMARIRSKDTNPELVVRSMLHRLGYRFRIHRRDLPGNPDIVLPRHRKIVLVHGCFWHGHSCTLASKPKTNQDYWQQKIKRNRLRDRKVKRDLANQGWQILELWECQIRKGIGLTETLSSFIHT
jgi:DNA mismatch endonuclease, patch repair protein